MFTDKKWNTLTQAAKNKKRVRYVNGRLQEREYTYYDRAERIYGAMGADQDLIAEEAVAEMFRDWADASAQGCWQAAVLRRIVRFFTSVFRSIDAGFKRASDIFQNIVTSDKEKQIGRRETNYGTTNSSQVNKKYSTAVAGYIVPEKDNLDRIKQSFKDVTKKIDALTNAAQKLYDGKISYDQYDKLVKRS